MQGFGVCFNFLSFWLIHKSCFWQPCFFFFKVCLFCFSLPSQLPVSQPVPTIQGEPQIPVATQPSVVPVHSGAHFLPVGQPLPPSSLPQYSVSQIPSAPQPAFSPLPVTMAAGINQPLLTLASSAPAAAVPGGPAVVPSQLPTLLQPVTQLPSQAHPQLLQPAVQSMGIAANLGQTAEAPLPSGDVLYQVPCWLVRRRAPEGLVLMIEHQGLKNLITEYQNN